MKNHFIFYFVLILILCSCIEEYQLKESAQSNERQVVIQGKITSGDKSVIHISYTQPLGSKEEPETVLNAKVLIVGQNGYQSEPAQFDMENDFYWIDTEELPSNTLYALQVEANGETFLSEYQALLQTPDIDEVKYEEKDESISIRLLTQGNEHDSSHYLWTYEEDWEFHAPVDIKGVSGIPFYDKNIYQQGFSDGYNPYYYCWGHNTSAYIHIYSTENLETNLVNIELVEIPADDIRISYIYSILVKQWSLSNEAYRYYRALEQYVEESSGLFAPMPSELKGNISCVSNPDVNVQGYVLASTLQTKRIFVYNSDFTKVYPQYDGGCSWKTPDLSDNNWSHIWGESIKKGAIAITTNGYYQPSLNPNYGESTLYSRECVDCRAVEGATKKRPDFWPTDHE